MATASKADFIADVQGRVNDAICATPTGDLRELLTEVNMALEMTKQTEADLRGSLRKVFGVGHDNDCIFCGFKDKAAKEGLDLEPGQRQLPNWEPVDPEKYHPDSRDAAAAFNRAMPVAALAAPQLHLGFGRDGLHITIEPGVDVPEEAIERVRQASEPVPVVIKHERLPRI
jgi:hypothetical protein